MSAPQLAQKVDFLKMLDKLVDALQLSTKDEANVIFMELLKNDVHISKLELCLKFIDINNGNDGVSNPLLFACCQKKFELVKFLVENGADVNKLSSNGTNSIMYSFQKADFETMIYLFQMGATLTTKEKEIGTFPPDAKSITQLVELFLSNQPKKTSE